MTFHPFRGCAHCGVARAHANPLRSAPRRLHAMGSFGLLALMVAVVAAQAPALRRQWLEDRAGSIKTLRLLAYYFVFIGVGFAVLLSAIADGAEGRGDAGLVAAIAFILAWIALGAGWLIKVVPR